MAAIRTAWRDAMLRRNLPPPGNDEPRKREASWRERSRASCWCAGGLVFGTEFPPTDPVMPRSTPIRRRLSITAAGDDGSSDGFEAPQAAPTPPLATPPSMAPAAPPLKPPPMVRGSSLKKNVGGAEGAAGDDNNTTPKKSARFAAAAAEPAPQAAPPKLSARRMSRVMQQVAWERATEHHHHRGVVMPYFDGSFHTVWGASSSSRHAFSPRRPDTKAAGADDDDAATCECHCSLPWTARVWGASKWYLCFLPAALCLPLTLPVDLCRALLCCSFQLAPSPRGSEHSLSGFSSHSYLSESPPLKATAAASRAPPIIVRT